MDSRMDKMDERFDRMDDRFDGMDKRMDEFNSELRGFKGETADNFRQIHERLDENAFGQRKERRHRESLERDLDKLTERLEKVEEHIGFERQ
jgi:archaellum component FlaC